MPEEVIGNVSDFFARPVVAGIELTGSLKVGDKIRSVSGLVEITSIAKVNSSQRICNITVRDFHNFYVSADGRYFYLVRE